MSLDKYPQVAVGLVAGFVLPLVLGAHHVTPVLFLAYASFAGMLFKLGEWVVNPGGGSTGLVRELVDWWVKALAVLLVGGAAFIVGYLLF